MKKIMNKSKRVLAMFMVVLMVFGLMPINPILVSADEEELVENSLTIQMDADKAEIEVIEVVPEGEDEPDALEDTDTESEDIFVYALEEDKTYVVTITEKTEGDVTEVLYGIFEGKNRVDLEDDGTLVIEVTAEKNAFSYDVMFESEATTSVKVIYNIKEIMNVVFDKGIEGSTVTTDGITTIEYYILPGEEVTLTAQPVVDGADVIADKGNCTKDDQQDCYVIALGECLENTTVNLTDDMIELEISAPDVVTDIIVYADDVEVSKINGVYNIKKGLESYVEFKSVLPLKKLVAQIGVVASTIVKTDEESYRIELGEIAIDAVDMKVVISEKELPKVTVAYPMDKISNITVLVDGEEVTGVDGVLEFEAEENVDYEVIITPVDDDAVVTIEGYDLVGISGDRTLLLTNIVTATDLSVQVANVYTMNFAGVYDSIYVLDEDGNVIETVTDGKLSVREDETDVILQIVPGINKYISKLQKNGTDVVFVEENFDLSDYSYVLDVIVVDGDLIEIETKDVVVDELVSFEDVLNMTYTGDAIEGSGVNVYYIHENVIITAKLSGARMITDSQEVIISKEINETCTIEDVTLFAETDIFMDGMIQKYTFDKAIKFVMDKAAPTIDASLSTEFFGPEALVIELAGTVTDDVEVDRVVYFTENKDIDADREDILSCDDFVIPQNEKYEISITLDESINADVTYYIYAIDLAGNISKVGPVTITYDDLAPVDGSVVITNVSAIFGNLFVRDPMLAVEVSGVYDTVGVAEIKVYVFDENDELVAEGCADVNNKIVFTNGIENGKAYRFRIVATDKLGNKGLVYDAEIIVSGTSYTQVSYDGTSPLVTVKPVTDSNTDGTYKKDSNTYYINKTILENGYLVKIDVNDYLEGNSTNPYISGLSEVVVKINGVEVDVDAEGNALTDYSAREKNLDSIKINLLQGTAVNGAYVITVDAKDNVGNACQTVTFTVYVDETAPVVQSITVNGSNATLGNAFQLYGFFTKDKFDIQVNGIDGANSIVDSQITHYIVEYLVGNEVVKTETVEGNQLVFTKQIADNFKGTIRVTVYDNVGNSSVTTVVNGLICEKEITHVTNAGATLTTPETSMKDVNGIKLYADNTSVNVVVTDTYAGINKIEWSVVAPFDKTNDAALTMTTAALATGWNAEATDNGIVTKVSGTIPVKNNSNGVVVTVTITDNVGNKTTKSVTVSIDKTLPVINVSVSGSEADSQYTNTFNGDRVATITIRERNFNASDVKVLITNTDQVIPSITTWTKKEDSSNPDNNTYTATVTFASDGDYTLDVSYTDLAKNEAVAPAQQKLTIDKTLPQASVNISGSALNGFYFATDRTATVVIIEHNFDATRVKLTGTATNNGIAVALPSISTWSTSGDTHTATIHFTEDANYQLVISGIDMAGNTFTYELSNFVIDKEVPTVTISGVTNQSANAGDVIPVITLGDINYDTNGVTITLVGSNNGTLDLDGSFSNTADGQVYTFNNIPEEQSYDDIYTLTVAKKDMAGNEKVETITFSVNRFGSVYTLSEDLKEVVGKYVKQPFEIVLTETNIDRLNHETIKVVLTVNGTPKTLIRDTDYTITESGSDLSWKQYVYSINTSVFEGDGSYSLAIYSVDSAGNVNENINEVKEAEVRFGIDTIAPIVEAINFGADTTYEEAFEASISIVDNIKLASVKILLDGKEVQPEEINGVYTFAIPAASERQTVVISATDSAGNITTVEYKDIFVPTGFMDILMDNLPLVIGISVGVVAIGGGTGAFVFFRKRNVIKVKK